VSPFPKPTLRGGKGLSLVALNDRSCNFVFSFRDRCDRDREACTPAGGHLDSHALSCRHCRKSCV